MPVGLAQNLSFVLLGEDKTASSAMGKVQTTAQKVTGAIGSGFSKLGSTIGGEFGGVLSTVGAGMEDLSTKTVGLGTKMQITGGLATAAGLALLKFGSAEKQATDQLEAAIKANGEAVGDYQEQIDKVSASAADLGHDSKDTKSALTILTQATGDTDKALDQMQVTLDLAAAKHISLSDAAGIVAKVYNGAGGKALKQYGIVMEKNADGTANSQKALEELAAKLKGQASAAVDNFGSQVDIVKLKVTDWAEAVSGPLGTALTIAGPLLMIVGTAVSIYQGKQQAATIATLAATVATEEQTIAQVGLNTAMSVNPALVVAGALVGLAAVAGGIALASTMNLTGATQDYTAALEAANGKIDENVQKQAIKALSESGALKAAQQLGIANETVVAATLGNADAQAKLNAALAAAKSKTDALAATEQDVIKQYGVGSIERVKLQGQLTDQRAAYDLLSSSVNNNRDAIQQQLDKYKLELSAMENTKKGLGLLADKYDTVSSAARRASHFAAGGGGGGPTARATGGVVRPGETTLVGENGPEIVKLPGGARVYPTGTGPAAGASYSGGGSAVVAAPSITIAFNGPVMDQAGAGKWITDVLVRAWNTNLSTGPIKSALGI